MSYYCEVMDKSEFVSWVEEEMEGRGWRPADLARAAGITGSALSKILNEYRAPGLDACVGIAGAFDLPPEFVLRKAGLIPELPGPDRDPTFQEIVDVMRNMTPEEREEVLGYALWRFRREKK